MGGVIRCYLLKVLIYDGRDTAVENFVVVVVSFYAVQCRCPLFCAGFCSCFLDVVLLFPSRWKASKQSTRSNLAKRLFCPTVTESELLLTVTESSFLGGSFRP